MSSRLFRINIYGIQYEQLYKSGRVYGYSQNGTGISATAIEIFSGVEALFGSRDSLNTSSITLHSQSNTGCDVIVADIDSWGIRSNETNMTSNADFDYGYDIIPDSPVHESNNVNSLTTTEPLVTTTTEIIQNLLTIHSGADANQSMNLRLDDMHTKSLGTGKLINDDGTFIHESDRQRYIALGLGSESPYQTDKQAEWLATVTAAQNKTLDDISVNTRYNANVAVRVLDDAIDYALDQATTIGAYLQRLEYTASNLTNLNENVQAAESAIRDADMAKTVTNYTKNNLLMSTAQSMLAHANQDATVALALLR